MTRRIATFALLGLGAAMIVVGLALIFPPAGLVAAGALVVAVVTFDPERASRLTWPR
jgi:hypothetical protein